MYKGFPSDFLDELLCRQPGCGGSLATSTPAAYLVEAAVHCERCRQAYPVQRGILRLLDPAMLDAESSHERVVRDEQAADSDYGWESTDWTQAEIDPTLNASQPLRAATVLELGAGCGRYSVRMAEQGARLVASDFSFGALRSLADRVKPHWTIGLVEADCTQVHVKPRSFDLVACTLMSNLPTAEHRASVYRLAVEALRDGGKFVFSTHHFSWRARSERKPQSGYYREGGIYRYLFKPREIRGEVARHFEAVACRPIQIHVPLSERLGLQKRLSRLAEHIWPVNRLGELLLVTARRPIRSLMAFALTHGLVSDMWVVAEWAMVAA